MAPKLRFLAGRKALAIIREKGLCPEDVRVVAGASGAAKWLVLSHLDRVVFSSWLTRQTRPIFLIGSSIGAWRFAALSQNNPNAAIEKLEHAYIHQYYSDNPSAAEITRESKRILDTFLDGPHADQVFDHPVFRLNILAVRSKNGLASETLPILALGLAGAAGLNAINRKFLGFCFERVLFFDPRDRPPFIGMNQFPLQRVFLNRENLKPAVLASGAIPLIMQGIRNIPGAPDGVYRDGGVIDYHLDIPFTGQNKAGIVLFPHFGSRIIPGWFDKKLFWRRPAAANMENVLLVCPSDAFVRSLPYGRIPDRTDFYRFKGRDGERVAYWHRVVDQCAGLGAEFMEAVSSGKIRQRVAPLLDTKSAVPSAWRHSPAV